VSVRPIFLLDLVAVVGLGVLAYGVGRRLTARVALASAAEAASLALPLGLGTLATATFLLGLVGLLRPAAVAVVLAIALAAGWPVWRGWARGLAGLPPCRPARVLVGLAVTTLGVVVAAPVVVLALYPPLASDATSFHLAMAKLHIASGWIRPAPFLRYPVFPLANESLFALVMLFAGDVAAQLVQCLMLLATAVLLYAWGARAGTPAVGLWAAALWLGNPLLIFFGTIAFVDVGLTLFVLAAAYSFFRWTAAGERAWLVLAGVFAGFAAGSKYSALFFVAVFGLAVVYRSVRERRWAPAVTFGLAAGLAGAPWYVYNAVQTGNPVFPFFGQLFAYGPWSATDLAEQVGDLRRYGMGRSPGALLRLPWNLASHPTAFHMEAPLSPVYGWLLPLTLVVAGVSCGLRGVLVLSIGYVVFWFASSQIARYLFPVLPLLSLLTAAAIERPTRPLARRLGRWPAAAVALLVAGGLVYPGWSFAVQRVRELGPLPTSRAERHAYLARWLPSYPVYHLLNEQRRSQYRLYQLLDESMAYFADGTFMGDWFGPARYAPVFERLRNGRALHGELRRLGADHFLIWINRYGGDAVTPPADDFFRSHFRPLYVQGPIALFEILE
jgi:hypothetical protein